jgi:hypothetical protein
MSENRASGSGDGRKFTSRVLEASAKHTCGRRATMARESTCISAESDDCRALVTMRIAVVQVE